MTTFPNVAVVLAMHLLIATKPIAAVWCVARNDVSPEALQNALDYACGAGADCAPVQESGACFVPDTVQAHASYAFNSYYMHSSMDPAACDFAGTATIAKTDPS
ncbi:putative carbohydrate-binding X8 domain-containing protein, plant [Helianthus debilis subsp. tardiflorus]